MHNQSLAEVHKLARDGEVDESALLTAFVNSTLLVPSRTDPQKGKLEPATSSIDGVQYVLAFDNYKSARKILGKELRKGFLPSVYGGKFVNIIAEDFGVAVGTLAGGVFTISPEMLKKYRDED